MLLICGIDCSTYLRQRDGFAEFSKRLWQTPSLAGPRSSGGPAFQSFASTSGGNASSRIGVSSGNGNLRTVRGRWPSLWAFSNEGFNDENRNELQWLLHRDWST